MMSICYLIHMLFKEEKIGVNLKQKLIGSKIDVGSEKSLIMGCQSLHRSIKAHDWI